MNGKTSPDTLPVRRGRPTQPRVEAIQNNILAAATALFLDGGYAATSMEAVALGAGVSKGTLYARYPTKPDLFKAIVADRLAAWSATGPVIAAEEGDVSALLRAHGAGFFASMRNPEIAAFDRLVLREAVLFPEIAEEFHDQGYVKGVAELAVAIERAGGKQGAMLDPNGVATAFASALLGWWRGETLRHAPDEAACQSFLDHLVDLLIGGRAAW